jgi:phosphoglycolate phosphatase
VLANALTLSDAALLDRLESAFRVHYDGGDWRKSPLYPDVARVLKELRDNGVSLHVLTNKPALATARILEHNSIAGFFGEVFTPDSVTPRFPDKLTAAQALRAKLPVCPGNTLLVGDSPDDARAAEAACFVFAAAAWGYGRVQERVPVRYALAEFADLTTVFDFAPV